MKPFHILVMFLVLMTGFYVGKNEENIGFLKLPKSDPEENTISDSTSDEIATTTENDEENNEENLASDDDSEHQIGILKSFENSIIRLFESAAPSVCYITTAHLRRDFWSRNIMEIPAGSGSGFIWDKSGHIVTNYHVVMNSEKISVTLSDQTTWQAKLVGIEPSKDLAVLKIDAPPSQLKPIKVGSSSKLRVGQFVMAIGNPFGLDQTLTTGVISALGREIQSLNGRPIRDVIQTDAAINPGNSGGPLLDSGGRLIGVNTQIYSPSGASAGIGFSIPVDEVKWVVPDIINYGEVRRPILGVSLLPEHYASQLKIKGVMVAEVIKGGPADKAGLKPISQGKDGSFKPGDIIKSVNDVKLNNPNDLILALEKYAPGDTVNLNIERNGKNMMISVVLGSSASLK